MKILLIVTALLLSAQVQGKAEDKLTLYTSRKTHLIEPLIKAYEKETGVKIEHINGKAGALIQRLIQEGAKTPADIFITVDAGNLTNAAQRDLLYSYNNPDLLKKVPEGLRDSKGRWYALSKRARTIFYNPKIVKESELTGYSGLADKKFKDKLCLRTSRKVYNQSLVAAMIDRLGKSKTKEVVEGWVANLAKPVFTSDTQLLEAVDKGICPIGIANTYYLARLKKEGKAENVKVFWPKKENGGVHINVSGAGILKHSDNKKAAQGFLTWLLQPKAQKLLAELNYEYPVVAKVEKADILKSWGSFERESASLDSIGENQKQAVMLMDKAKYR